MWAGYWKPVLVLALKMRTNVLSSSLSASFYSDSWTESLCISLPWIWKMKGVNRKKHQEGEEEGHGRRKTWGGTERNWNLNQIRGKIGKKELREEFALIYSNGIRPNRNAFPFKILSPFTVPFIQNYHDKMWCRNTDTLSQKHSAQWNQSKCSFSQYLYLTNEQKEGKQLSQGQPRRAREGPQLVLQILHPQTLEALTFGYTNFVNKIA